MSLFLNYFQRRSLEKKLGHFRKKLFRIAFSWSHDAMLADDLVQDTLTKALTRLDQLNNSVMLEAWLSSILNHIWIDYLRQKKEFEDIDNYIHVSLNNDSPESLYEQDHSSTRLHKAISILPMGQRQVISLVDVEGYTYKEVSQILSIPVGTVMSRLNRARKTLIETLNGNNNVFFLTNKKTLTRANIGERA